VKGAGSKSSPRVVLESGEGLVWSWRVVGVEADPSRSVVERRGIDVGRGGWWGVKVNPSVCWGVEEVGMGGEGQLSPRALLESGGGGYGRCRALWRGWMGPVQVEDDLMERREAVFGRCRALGSKSTPRTLLGSGGGGRGWWGVEVGPSRSVGERTGWTWAV